MSTELDELREWEQPVQHSSYWPLQRLLLFHSFKTVKSSKSFIILLFLNNQILLTFFSILLFFRIKEEGLELSLQSLVPTMAVSIPSLRKVSNL